MNKVWSIYTVVYYSASIKKMVLGAREMAQQVRRLTTICKLEFQEI